MVNNYNPTKKKIHLVKPVTPYEIIILHKPTFITGMFI